MTVSVPHLQAEAHHGRVLEGVGRNVRRPQGAIGAGRDDDAVLAAGIHGNDCDTGGDVGASDPRNVYAGVGSRFKEHGAVGVVTHSADQDYMPAELAGSHRLVGTLAAGGVHCETVAVDCLAGLGGRRSQ